MGVFKVLSDTELRESCQESTYSSIARDAENQISFHYFGVLGIIIGHLYLVVTPGKPKVWKMRNADDLGTTVNVLSLNLPFIETL